MSLKLEYYYNVDTQRFCDSDGSGLALEQLPRITLVQQAVFALTFIKDDGTPATFNADDTFSWAADDDWDESSDVLMQTVNENINDVADWANADPTAGLISIVVDANSAPLQTALDTSKELLVHGEIKVYASGITNPYYVGQMDFYARNLVDHAGLSAPAPTSNFYTKAETLSLLSSYLPTDHSATALTGSASITGAVAMIMRFVDDSGGDVTVSLPDPTAYPGMIIELTCATEAGNNLILSPDGADTINNEAGNRSIPTKYGRKIELLACGTNYIASRTDISI